MNFEKEVLEAIKVVRTFPEQDIKDYLQAMFEMAYIMGERAIIKEQAEVIKERMNKQKEAI